MNRALCSVTLAVIAAVVPTVNAKPIPTEEPVRLSPSDLLGYDQLKDAGFNEVTRVQGLELPTGQKVSMRLEWFTVRRGGARVIAVDAQGIEREIGDNGLRLFRGSIEGNPDSTVFIASSPYFTNGFIDDNKALYSVTSGHAIEPNSLAVAQPIVITDVNSLVFDNKAPSICGVDPAFENFVDLAANFSPVEPVHVEREQQCRVVDIAIDTDYEYTSRLFGGNTNASSAYAETLLGAVSTIYERDVRTTLVTGYVRVFAANNDPYTDSGDALDQVVAHWKATKSNVERKLVHYLSGRRNLSYGGVAYLSALCDPNQGYGVSAYLDGAFPQPLQDNVSGNWDIVVMAHELGHNHGTGHTHDSYVPVIDGCGNGDCTLAASGTLMSYCHTCSGGISNIRLAFHARVKAVMNTYLGNQPSCNIINPDWDPDALANDDFVTTFSGIRTPINVLENDTKGTCTGYRPTIGSYSQISANGGTITIDTLPMSTVQAFYYKSPTDFAGIDTFTYTNSWGEPATVTVDVQGYRPPDVVGDLVAGLNADYFAFEGPLDQIPATDGLTPFSSEHLSEIDFPESLGNFAGSGLSQQFAAKITGYFIAPIRAHYTFFLDSDDGSRLTIGDSLVVDHDGAHAFSEAAGEIPLDEGPHALTLEYYQGEGSSGLQLSYSALGSIKAIVNQSSFKSDAPVVVCPVDLNDDGVVDNGDIGVFVSLFLAGDTAADFNDDGVLDNGDIGAFVAAFLAGC